MKVIPKYEIFLVRYYYKKDYPRPRFHHFDTLNKGQQDFPQNKLFDFLSFEGKDVFFEIYSGNYTYSTTRIFTTFNRTSWYKNLTDFQEKGEPFTVRFFRPTNIIDSHTILNDGFNEIWKSL